MNKPWPPLSYETLKGTLGAIHMWTQIVGKIRLEMTPLVNHWWNSTLIVTPRGLTTGVMPSGDGAFQIDLDFVGHELTIVTNRGQSAAIPLRSMSVAQFYGEVLEALARVGVSDPQIVPVPNEVAVAVPFPDDVEIRPYDRGHARLFATALLKTHIVFERFRAGFLGKASPVQFFWGSFDLASARFSGRHAPPYAGGKPPNVDIHVMHEAYSHELIAAGFWLGSAELPRPEFYAYAMPAPDGIEAAPLRPATAEWSADRGEFLLPYEAVRRSADPAAMLLEFLESTYDAAANLAHWDRQLLEEPVVCNCDPMPSRIGRREQRAFVLHDTSGGGLQMGMDPKQERVLRDGTASEADQPRDTDREAVRAQAEHPPVDDRPMRRRRTTAVSDIRVNLPSGTPVEQLAREMGAERVPDLGRSRPQRSDESAARRPDRDRTNGGSDDGNLPAAERDAQTVHERPEDRTPRDLPKSRDDRTAPKGNVTAGQPDRNPNLELSARGRGAPTAKPRGKRMTPAARASTDAMPAGRRAGTATERRKTKPTAPKRSTQAARRKSTAKKGTKPARSRATSRSKAGRRNPQTRAAVARGSRKPATKRGKR